MKRTDPFDGGRGVAVAAGGVEFHAGENPLWRWGAQPPPTADFIRSAVGVPVTRGHVGGEIDPERIVAMVMSAFVGDGAGVVRLFDPDSAALAAVSPARGQGPCRPPLR
jgi:hypothetical protein